jgi:hypothetical protein
VLFAARVVTLVATIWITAISFWEVAAPFGAGHFAAATAVATGGENMLRHGIIGAVPRFMTDAPAPADYYCHHPWGTFWTAALFVGVFGHHDFVARLPAALMSSVMPLLLYRAGRALFGPSPGALAAAAYVVTPITLAYANFFALEVPTMFAMALATYATVRFSQTQQTRFGTLSVVGLLLAASYDWTGFVFAALVLGVLFLRGFVFRRSFPSFDFQRFATFWASAVCLVALLALFFVAKFAELGQLGTLVAQGNARASGSSLPLGDVLESRKYWILLAFTPVAIGLGLVAAPLAVARALLYRREGELLPIAVLVTAVLQYVGFKQGADIHFFWPQYFALYFAYAFGMLAASADDIGRFALAKLERERHVPTLRSAVLGTGLVVALSMAPDAVRALHWARKSGGRFNEKGLIIHPDLDKAAVFAHLKNILPSDARLGVDASMKPSYWMDFALEREVTISSFPSARNPSATTHFALDARFTPSGSLRLLAREHAVGAYGPFWIVDTEAPAAPIEGFSTLRREPTFFERWVVSSHHALHSVKPDPFWTWELREHFGVTPNPPPARAPDAFEQRRIAHNLAISTGDVALAERLQGELLAAVDQKPARDYSHGIRLLGVRLERGASDVLTVLFRAEGPLAGDPAYTITSFVESAPKGSLVPRDELPWNVGMPFALPASFWRPGFVYSSVTELMRRPGRERYVGAFTGTGAPGAVSGPPETTLLVLE